MKFYLYLLAGLVSGILGGMGMGGGTVLIPVLTIFLGVEQHVAQATNLLAFLPMAVFSLSVHRKKGLLNTKDAPFIVVPALITSTLASIVAAYVSGGVLQKLFGFFLIGLAIRGVTQLKFLKRL